MYPTSHLARPAHEDEAASGLLGRDHALARALAVRRVLVKQSLLVAVVVFAGVLALIEHASAASSVLLGAVVVEATLACAVAISSCRTRDRVIELIVDGREDLPLLAIERERRRLLNPGNREALAARIDQVRLLGRQSSARRDAWPLHRPTIARVAPELDRVAALLRSGRGDARAAAMIERLLSEGTSPLYGRDPLALSEQLHRIRFHLEA
jgi:hypothetical protein